MLLENHFGCARYVYNWALSEKEKHYRETGKSLSKRTIQDLMIASKKTDSPWLAEVNSQSLLAALANLDTALSNFFKGLTKFFRFKKKYASWQSFRCPQHVSIDTDLGVINLPKIKGIKARLHRFFSGKIKTVTIKKSPTGKYFASVLVDEGATSPVPTTIEPDKAIGINVGLSQFLTDSRQRS